jgi:uncharacterized protein DUF4407
MTDLMDPPTTPSVRSSLPNDAGVGAFRPVMPKRGIPRLMRQLVGIDEDILDWVPEERPRYTRLGFIVFNTGLLAGMAMHFALTSVTNAAWWLLLPVDLFWAFVIITIDSWLVSSTHGIERSAGLGAYLPRLLVSILLGVIIAEPLVLAVFHQSIDNEISEYRKTEVDDYESLLKRCNPPSGEPSAAPSCVGLLVTIKERPQAIQDELNQATVDRDALKKRVDAADRQLAQYEDVARAECAGTASAYGQTTGDPGEGGECRRDRTISDNYRADSQIDQLHKDLAAAEQRVTDLTATLASAKSSTEQQVNTAIDAEVLEKRENLDDRGLLDEIDALGRLSSKHLTIGFAHLFLALLLVLLDCLPVLSKLMSSRTAYDERVRNQLDAEGRLHNRQLRTSERRDTVDLEIQERRLDQKLRTSMEDITGEDRSAKERRRIELDAQIDRLAAAIEQGR